MECKSISFRISWFNSSELIDTLWNVNFFFFAFVYAARIELIDTLWNVNKYAYVLSTNGA